MSTNSPNTEVTQEVDLSAVSRSIGSAFKRLNSFLYRCIRFVLRNLILIGALFIIGAALGYWLDSMDKGEYKTQIIVSPNFGSTDYLYAKVDQLESKLKEHDTVFLSKIGIKNPDDLKKINISPVIDVFKFVGNSGSETNYRLIELMAQDGDIKKIVADNTTSKNYPYHMITFTTSGKTNSDKTIIPLMNYLNDNAYFKKIQKEYLKNVQEKMQANDTMISQIDGLLKEFANDSGKSSSVYISENAQLNDVLKTKDELVKEQGIHRVDLVGLDRVIKDNSIIPNIKEEKTSPMVILPLFFIFIFLCINAFRMFYRSQKKKYNATT